MGVDEMAEQQDSETVERAAEFLEADEASSGEAGSERLSHVQALGERIVEALQTVFDPEIPVNIYELGLIYKIDIHDNDSVTVEMTLTSPHCPVAETLPIEVQNKVTSVEGVPSAEVEITWDPPWHPSMMSEDAQLELGMIY